MRIAILGAGNAGTAVAGDLTQKGYDVTLIKTSTAMHNDNYEFLINNGNILTMEENDNITKVKIHKVCNDLSEIKNNDIIIIYIQTKYHEDLIKKISPYLNKSQIVIINPGYLSTCYMLKYCTKNLPIVVEAESSFIDCRIMEPGYIKVWFRNVRNPLGVYPKEKQPIVEEKLKNFGYGFNYVNIVEAALHNPNLIVHTVGGIMSIPRIEKTNGDYYMYHEVFTPTVWNILEELDSEKMNVLEKLGYDRLPYVEACKFRNSIDDERDAKEVFFWYANMPTMTKGPTTVNSRYITEDVPEGLVMLETLGKELKINTPVCSSLIELASFALKTDFRKEGRTLKKLGKKNIDKIIKNSKIEK